MTQTAAQIAETTPYLFINDTDNDKVLVCKKDWFSWMPITDTYNSHGIQHADEFTRYCDQNDDIKAKCTALGESDHCEECNEAIYQVKAYNYWDGSNHRSLIIESPDFDTDVNVIDDEDEIAKYVALMAKFEQGDFYTEQFGTGYRGTEIDGFRIVQSQWQGDFELYQITEIE